MTRNKTSSEILEIKLVAQGRWLEILPAVGGIDRELLDGRHHPCPKCGGKDRFRMVDKADGALFCNQCFNTKNGDGLAAIQWLRSCDFPTALSLITDHLGIESGGNGRLPIDTVAAMARMKNIPVESLVAFGATNDKRGKLQVCRVPTHDADMTVVGHLDLAPSPDFDKGKMVKGCKHGLFVAERPKPGDTACIVEGPKDAAALHGLGIASVGLPTFHMAAGFARFFRGVHVIIIPDRDKAGIEGAEKTAARLHGVAASVRIAELPADYTETNGADTRDVLHTQDGESKVRDAIKNAREWKPAAKPQQITSDGYPMSDTGLAERFAAQHAENVRYCWPWGKWLAWDGCRWKIDDSGRVNHFAKQTARSILKEAATEPDKDQCKKLAGFALASESMIRRRAMLNLAQSEPGIPILPDALDRDPWLLNCPNGTIDLRSGELHEHRQEDLLTKVCPTEFHPNAKSALWESVLQRVFDDNERLISFVQRLFGYAICGEIVEHVLPVLHGSGSNGKSTVLNAIKDTLGEDYAIESPPDLLMIRRGQHPTELARLAGRRLVVAIETEENAKLAESLVKQLTGGDMVSCRRMREDFWEYRPSHTIFLACNHRPVVKGVDLAIWRRILLLPFFVVIPEPEQDKRLPAKLRDEAEGILAWLVAGCQAWQERGLEPPEEVRAATADYRTEEDTLGAFFVECCTLLPDATIPAKDLYAAYRKFCEEGGERPISQRRFGTRMTDREFVRYSNDGTWYRGIDLAVTEPTEPWNPNTT